ncbi:MAG: hypothetical protein GXO37_04540 [Chloroflexi bacterium]|nr:hypothetical protein [Chloroflexota bacterium]
MTANTSADRTPRTVRVNRAPVLTLWAAVVAHALGYPWDEALTMGRVVAGLAAHRKGVALGLYETRPAEAEARERRRPPGEYRRVFLMGFPIEEVRTPQGWRALDSQGRPIQPEAVERYLRRRFGAAYPAVRAALEELAAAYPPERLAREAWQLYLRFRPQVPKGVEGWGKKGVLDLERIRALARQAASTAGTDPAQDEN